MMCQCHWIVAVVITYFYLFICINCQSKVEVNKDDDGVFKDGKISFSTPDLNDDESHSPFMPDSLKCDACLGIAYQLFTRFEKYNALHKYGRFKIPESELLDIFEETCTSDTFSNYGIKTIKGANRLSGEGLPTADTPGILAGGGKWPTRMMDMCEQFAGEVGEMEVYTGYSREPHDIDNFNTFLCHGSGILGHCRAKPRQRPAGDEL